MNIGGQKVSFKSVLRGYWTLWKGKLLQGKSNNEIIAEELEKARQLPSRDRVAQAKLEDTVERLIRHEE